MTYVVKIASAGYLGNFLKLRTSENRITEIRRSQGPGVCYQNHFAKVQSTIVTALNLALYLNSHFQTNSLVIFSNKNTFKTPTAEFNPET